MKYSKYALILCSVVLAACVAPRSIENKLVESPPIVGVESDVSAVDDSPIVALIEQAASASLPPAVPASAAKAKVPAPRFSPKRISRTPYPRKSL